jgi:hypothetical protein
MTKALQISPWRTTTIEIAWKGLSSHHETKNAEVQPVDLVARRIIHSPGLASCPSIPRRLLQKSGLVSPLVTRRSGSRLGTQEMSGVEGSIY